MTLADLDIDKRYTNADYFKWRFEERVEWIKGKLFQMRPAPGFIHQSISSIIHGELYLFLIDKKRKAYSAPFDWVVFPPGKNILVYTLVNGKHLASPFLYPGDSVISTALPGCSVNLELLFGASNDNEYSTINNAK